MTTQTEALKMALEALENPDGLDEYNRSISDNAITAIKEALAQQSNEQVEPVARIDYWPSAESDRYIANIVAWEHLPVGTLLYTHPPVPTAQPKETEQEPVAWDGDCVLGHCGSPAGCEASNCCRADYTTPPPVTEPHKRKPWVSLSTTDIGDCIGSSDGTMGSLIHATEAKLRELNEAPQRKPLTDEQIETIWHDFHDREFGYAIRFARAIEAAHGIKE